MSTGPDEGADNELLACLMRWSLPFRSIVRFEPLTGQEPVFRDEVLRVNEPSRAGPGCLRIDEFESLREPHMCAIHFDLRLASVLSRQICRSGSGLHSGNLEAAGGQSKP
jgi:hypothetical protein